MHEEGRLEETQKEWHGTVRSYVIGFSLSLLLTISSFLLVLTNAFSKETLPHIIGSLALLQAFFQIRYFLHVGEEPKPRWESLVFYFMMLVLVIIVAGSLWIMHDLNARVMDMSHD